MENSKLLTDQYNQAAEAIKTAILQSQYGSFYCFCGLSILVG